MSVVVRVRAAPAQQARVELADIFARHGDAYFASHYVTRTQRKVARAIFNCRTAALGGHRQWCQQCGHENLGGKVGFTMVLHTWDQQLRPHFHVHCVIAAGALSEDGSRWIEAGKNFLFPVRALSKVFRAKYLESLQKLLDNNKLDVPNHLTELNSPQRWLRWLRTLQRKAWAVYSKAPFAGPQKLLDYLGRYTHRVAISNHRLLACEHGQVATGGPSTEVDF